jgi:hypothetical protein
MPFGRLRRSSVGSALGVKYYQPTYQPTNQPTLGHIEDKELSPPTMEDADKNWLADTRVDQNHPYLRIRDAPAAEASRGRLLKQPNKPASLPPRPAVADEAGWTAPARALTPAQGVATPRRSQQRGGQPGGSGPRSGHRSRTGEAPTQRLAGSTSDFPPASREVQA